MLKVMTLIAMTLSMPLHLLSVRYNYSYHGHVIHSAPGMTFAAYMNEATLGVALSSPEDLKVFGDYIYLVDSRTDALLIINRDFTLVEAVTTFTLNEGFEAAQIASGEEDPQAATLNGPFGLDVKESGIYICDTGNNRIVKLNHDLEVVGIFDTLEDPTFDTLDFEPRKITVDASERMYVVARNVYEGIIELDSDGSFNRFTGVNPLRLNAIEILRRSLMSEAQLAQMRLYLPTEYTNVSIDHRSFIYATSKPSEGNAENMIQLINPKGVDVLRRNGYHPPMGDVHFMIGMNNYVITGPSDLVAIANTDYGIYTVLDQKRSRLFTYDAEGNLLYINGDRGGQSDRFLEGVALDYLDDDLLVLDRRTRTIVVYRLTEFGRSVNAAIALQAEGDFASAADIWQDVLRLNSNYEVAYNGIGKHYLREGRYREAMDYFNLGHDYFYYSKAFQQHRNTMIRENFTVIALTGLIVGSALAGLKIRKVYRKGGSLLYED